LEVSRVLEVILNVLKGILVILKLQGLAILEKCFNKFSLGVVSLQSSYILLIFRYVFFCFHFKCELKHINLSVNYNFGP
jgi:hypothetical protein